MKLLTGETILSYSDESKFQLTNMRIRYEYKKFGEANVDSIFLEKIASIQLSYTSHFWLLLLVLISLIAGIPLKNEIAGVIAAVIFGIAYYFSMQYVLKISSDGGGYISFQVKGMEYNRILEMIDSIEDAKNNRVNNFKVALP